MNVRMWRVALREMRESLRRRSFIFLTFVVPLLAVVLVGAVSLYQQARGPQDEEAQSAPLLEPIGFVDHSGVVIDPVAFGGMLLPYESEATAREAVDQGEIAAFYVVPEDYLETGEVTRYAQQINVAGDMPVFEALLRSSLLADQEPLLAARVQSPATIVTHQVARDGGTDAGREVGGMDLFWIAYVFGILLMLTTFMTSGQVMGSVILEKENRVIEIVLSSLRPMALMAGKLLGQGLMGLMQLFTWLFAIFLMVTIADVDIPFLRFLRAAQLSWQLAAAALIYFALGFALYGAMAAAIGAVSVNMREGPQYAMIYTLPAAMSIMFLPMMAEEPGGALALGLSIFPMTAPIAMMERLAVATVPLWQVALSMVLLALSVWGALWLAGRLFRANTLLSGQLPDVRGLWAIVAGEG